MGSEQRDLKEQRARMAEALETLFAFDYGLTGPELYGQVAWLLDEVVWPELVQGQGVQESWCVKQAQAVGREPVAVRKQLTKSEALAVCKGFPISGSGKVWIEREWP